MAGSGDASWSPVNTVNASSYCFSDISDTPARNCARRASGDQAAIARAAASAAAWSPCEVRTSQSASRARS